jgi:hypothetical protein
VYPQPPILDAQLRQREIDINPIEIPVRVMKLGDPSATKSALAGIGRAATVGNRLAGRLNATATSQRLATCRCRGTGQHRDTGDHAK